MVVEIDDVVDAVFVEVDVVEAEIVENDGVVVNEWGCFLKNMSNRRKHLGQHFIQYVCMKKLICLNLILML